MQLTSWNEINSIVLCLLHETFRTVRAILPAGIKIARWSHTYTTLGTCGPAVTAGWALLSDSNNLSATGAAWC